MVINNSMLLLQAQQIIEVFRSSTFAFYCIFLLAFFCFMVYIVIINNQKGSETMKQIRKYETLNHNQINNLIDYLDLLRRIERFGNYTINKAKQDEETRDQLAFVACLDFFDTGDIIEALEQYETLAMSELDTDPNQFESVDVFASRVAELLPLRFRLAIINI